MQKLNALRTTMGISTPILLLETAALKVPAVYGCFQPVIFIPRGLMSRLPPAQVEAILWHELAHIRRKDYQVNLFQQIVEVIFFFNPAVLWLSALIREEREFCCDEIASKQIGDRKLYAEIIINVKDLSLVYSRCDVPAFTGAKAGLTGRVNRLVSKQNPTLNLYEKSAIAGCGLALLLWVGFYRPSSTIAYSSNAAQAANSYNDFPLAHVIANLSRDLIKDGLINDTRDVSFKLTNTELLVNGVRQTDGFWSVLYTRYLRLSPYPIRPELRDEPDFGIFYNSKQHITGIGTTPPGWNN